MSPEQRSAAALASQVMTESENRDARDAADQAELEAEAEARRAEQERIEAAERDRQRRNTAGILGAATTQQPTTTLHPDAADRRNAAALAAQVMDANEDEDQTA